VREENVEGFPLIETKGGALERGRQHGEQASDLIRFNLEGYRRLFKHDTGLDWSEVLSRARQYERAIEEYAPHLLEEMRGIAEGAGVSLDDILALNCRTEILSMTTIPLLGECTALFVAPEATADGHSYVAQNWDWSNVLRGGTVLLRVEQSDRPTVLTLTEAGMVGKIGLNSAGIGVCTNFLRHDHRRIGVPFHVLLRSALEADRLGLAVAAIYRGLRADSGNYLLAHADGEAVDLEATPSDVGFLFPQEGVLVHTNHFLTPRLQAGDVGIVDSDNTLARYGRAVRLLNGSAGKVTLEVLQGLFRDHFNYPHAICRHPDPTLSEIERGATLASIIIDLTAGEMYVSMGEPCQAEYTRLCHDRVKE
jgi:isopenicillin-N N-acyltransferase-like protein